MKRILILVGALLVALAVFEIAVVQSGSRVWAQASQSAPALPVVEARTDFFKISPDQNFGEVLGVAVNSKGNIVVLNHPGSATTGPLYGNATTQLWEFDSAGNFIREIGKGVYGLGYAHAVRFDQYDNLWVVDKGTNAVMKFNPSGYVTMNLGRRPEGYDSFAGHYERSTAEKAVPRDGLFDGPTDVGWDPQDNIYVSEGYVNNRIAKMDKNGDWIKTWGKWGPGGENADENPGSFRNVHNMQVDAKGNVYAGDRGNRRIHVFDSEGNFIRFIHLNAPYNKKRHPALGNLSPNMPDQTAPWSLCITPGPTQYLYVVDSEPGRLYKLTLEGRILGVWGESGRGPGQLNWPHGLACPSNELIYIADMNNWRVQRLVIKPQAQSSAAR